MLTLARLAAGLALVCLLAAPAAAQTVVPGANGATMYSVACNTVFAAIAYEFWATRDNGSSWGSPIDVTSPNPVVVPAAECTGGRCVSLVAAPPAMLTCVRVVAVSPLARSTRGDILSCFNPSWMVLAPNEIMGAAK